MSIFLSYENKISLKLIIHILNGIKTFKNTQQCDYLIDYFIER